MEVAMVLLFMDGCNDVYGYENSMILKMLTSDHRQYSSKIKQRNE